MLAAAFALLLAAAPPEPAPAQTSAKPEPHTVQGVDVVKTPDPGKPKVVCRREAVLGSRMTKKVCTDAAAKAERTAEDRQNLERIQTAIPTNQY